jgi:pimeloyl-ACP methyl ester carboxylesterase
VTNEAASQPRPRVEVVRRHVSRPSALIIVAHGGASRSRERAHRFRLTYVWQLYFSRWATDAVRDTDTQIWRLRYRYRGWNGAAADAAQDLQWAVRKAAELYPGCPVILVGHSMGGRACVYAAGEPNVAAVCLLAPWIEEGDPIGDLSGRPVLIVHGTADHITNPRTSAATAAAEGATFVPIEGEGHFMVKQPRRWREVSTTFLQQQVAAISRG